MCIDCGCGEIDKEKVIEELKQILSEEFDIEDGEFASKIIAEAMKQKRVVTLIWNMLYAERKDIQRICDKFNHEALPVLRRIINNI